MPTPHPTPVPSRPREAIPFGMLLMPAPGQIHLWSWTAGTEASGEDVELLDPTERARAARFRFGVDRERYVARHAFTRRILAGYLGCAPGEVPIVRTAHGRPLLAERDRLDFNTTHAGPAHLLAVTSGAEVGVDLEQVRPMQDAGDLARRFFTLREQQHLAATTASARSVAFLRLWTRKEAAVKATGMGLSTPLDHVDVLDPQVCLPGPTGPQDVHVTTLDIDPGFVGAIACTIPIITISPMRLDQARAACGSPSIRRRTGETPR